MTQLTRTTKPTKQSSIQQDWHLLDASGKTLGRFAVEAAGHLIGKNKSTYVPNLDSGDNVVIINAEKIKITGRKNEQKIYTRYSGYPGGLKKMTYKELFAKDPRKVIMNAVSGMLPKNKLRSRRMTRLFVFNSNEHTFTDKFNS